MKGIHKSNICLIDGKWYQLDIGTDTVYMNIIIVCGNVFPFTRLFAVESWRTSSHLCGVRKDLGSRLLPCNYLAGESEMIYHIVASTYPEAHSL